MKKEWNKAIADLEKGGTYIEIAEEIKTGGINSEIIKVKEKRSGATYALKFYSNAKDERMLRQSREIAFLKYAAKTRNIRTPDLVDFSLDDQWCLLQWIEGEKVSKLTKVDIDQIIEFIKELNEPDIEPRDVNLLDAKDKLINLEQTIRVNQLRLGNILEKEPRNDVEIRYKDWIEQDLGPTIENTSINALKNNKKELWVKREFIASPSDVGAHNMIKNGDSQFFIDFEYAGYDDICKLVSDWIIHPNRNLGKEEGEYFLRGIEKAEITDDDKWEDRLRLVIPIFQLKWCLIMLKPYMEGKGTEKNLEKVKDYFLEFKSFRLR